MSYIRILFSLLITIVMVIPTGAEAAGLAYTGQTPSDALSSSYPGNGSLYYGQYSQSIPLYSLGTGGGPEVSISLSYNSNVHNIVKVTNRDAQASWVGLGFELGGEAISTNHRYTADISDDEYYFVGNGGTVRLYETAVENVYMLSSGSQWSIERTVLGDWVVGWTIKKEDGTIYKYGDFVIPPSDADERNATRCQLGWGSDVGVGSSQVTYAYPFHWDVWRIEDISGDHWLEYEYQRNEDNMRRVNTYDVDASGNVEATQTRDSIATTSLPYTITSSNDEQLKFIVESRDDWEYYYAGGYQEFQNMYRLKKIEYWGLPKYTIPKLRSSVVFYYTEWNTTSFTTNRVHKKSLLDSLVVHGVPTIDKLPSTKFSYYLDQGDVNRGALKEVELPGGGVHRITYRTIEPEKMLTTLDYLDDNDARSYSSRVFSRSCYIGKWIDENSIRHFEVGSWNGYWDVFDLDDITDEYDGRDINSDSPIDVAAGEGWVVLYQHNQYDTEPHRFIVLEERGGLWKRDTIDISWDRNADTFVEIHVGDRFFVATERVKHKIWNSDDILIDIQLRALKNAYYYARTDNGWTENYIYSPGVWTPDFLGLQLSNGVFGLLLSEPNDENTDRQLIYGAYDYETNQLNTQLADSNSYQHVLMYAVGVNSVAWTNWNTNTIHLASWEPNQPGQWYTFSKSLRKINNVTTLSQSLVPLRSGFLVSTKQYQNEPPEYGLEFFIKGGTGYIFQQHSVCFGRESKPVSSAGGDAFTFLDFLSGSSFGTRIMYLSGTWQDVNVFNDHPIDYWNVVNSEELIVGQADNDDDDVVACRRGSYSEYGSGWSNSGGTALIGSLPVSDHWQMDGARDLISFTREKSTDYSNIWQWEEDDWVQYDITNLVPPTAVHAGCSDNLFRKGGNLRNQRIFSDRMFYTGGVDGKAAIQIYDRQYSGKPAVVVLDKIEILGHANDPLPIVQTYDYDLGTMDPAVSCGRFARVSVSTPYFAGESPEGYSISKFYNDLDDDQFPGLGLPDLQSVATYGLIDGGYLLDGMVYESYDSSATDGAGTPFDFRKYEYKVFGSGDHWTGIYQPRLVRTETRVDQIVKSETRTYDDLYRLVLTASEVGGGVIRYDSVKYADFSADLNIFTQPGVKLSWLDSVGVIQHLSRTAYSWLPDGTGLEYDASWPDASSEVLAEARYGFKTIPGYPNQGRDQHNNLIAWTVNAGDTLSAKYCPFGKFKIASVSGAVPDEYLLFDGDHGYYHTWFDTAYDGWLNEDGSGTISETESSSGFYSFLLLEAATGSLQNHFDFYQGRLSHIYFLSVWVKTGGTLTVDMDVYDDAAGYANPHWEFTGSGEWQKIELTVDFDTLGLSQLDYCVLKLSKLGGDTYIDDVRLHPVDVVVNTQTFDRYTGTLRSSSGPSNLPTTMLYDSFLRPYRTIDHKNRVLSESAFAFSRDSTSDGSYDLNKPNFVKSTSYRDGQEIESFAYSDGLGRVLQTRREVEFNGEIKTLVSGITNLNARGQVLRTYKPYIDLLGAAGVRDYTVQALPEMFEFYDGTHAVNCGYFPYSSIKYESNFKSRVSKTGQPGETFNVDYGNHTLHDQYTWINGSDTLLVSTTTDQDGIVTAAKSDLHGRYSAQVSHYLRDDDTMDSILTLSYNDRMFQHTCASIDTGSFTQEITLRESWGNDLGQVDSTWKVDYGMVNMVRDTKGKLRFTQNDLRRSQSEYVYFKYDPAGRMIEEGVYQYPDPLYFSRTYADNPDFPSAADNPDVKYRRYYDHYYYYDAVADTGYNIVSPGALVRVENAAGSYFKQFYAFPEDDYGLTITQLPNWGSLKGTRSDFHEDGSLKSYTIYPDWPNVTTGTTVMEYSYDEAGRTKSITDASQTTFAEYAYEADGSTKQLKYGMDLSGANPIQVIDYAYDSRGMLTSINDVDNVSTSITGTADHFGVEIDYTGSGAGYYNGRVYSIRSVNTGVSSTQDHQFVYSYNELGWLEDADETGGTFLDRLYKYNGLGNRVLYGEGVATPSELEYEITEGSSRLIRDYYYQNPMEINYDILGNLTSDATRGHSNLDYEYRNLLSDVSFWTLLTHGEAGPKPQPRLAFTYDENGQRLAKLYIDFHLDSTEVIDDPRFLGMGGTMMMGPGPPPPDTIIDPPGGSEWNFFWAPDTTFTYYWYAGSTVIATFDENDQRLEGFVNGPSGCIASFSGPDNTYPNYFLNDHLGSTRVIMSEGPGGSRSVTQCINYLPFGKVFEEWGNYQTNFQYTSKELDAESGFNHNYFGARYYDPHRGRFTSLDKANQFASGYIYGGNNPISMVDPDGNWVVGALAVARALLAGYQTVTAMMNGDANGMFLSVLSFYGIPTGMPNLYQGSNLGYSVASSALTSAANGALRNAASGGDWRRGLRGSLGMGAASGFFGSQQFRNWDATGEFRSFESSARRHGLSGSPMYASADATRMHTYKVDRRATQAWLEGIEKAGYIDFDIDYDSEVTAFTKLKSFNWHEKDLNSTSRGLGDHDDKNAFSGWEGTVLTADVTGFETVTETFRYTPTSPEFANIFLDLPGSIYFYPISYEATVAAYGRSIMPGMADVSVTGSSLGGGNQGHLTLNLRSVWTSVNAKLQTNPSLTLENAMRKAGYNRH